jgi:hypothetical protein
VIRNQIPREAIMTQKQPEAFRDFGILPQGIQPPPEVVRCFLTQGRIIGQYIGTGIVSTIGLGLALLLLLFLPLPLNLLGGVAFLMGVGAVVYLATHNDYRWVELDGHTLRAKQLYTGRIVERSLEDIDSLGTMVYQVRRLQTIIIESLLGRVKGIEVRFRDGRTPLRILRADPAMANAKELIEAIVYKMGKIREVDAEIVEFAGSPLVRRIYWKDQQPSPPPTKNLKVILMCGLLLALMFGFILGFWGRAADKLQKLSSLPPRQVNLQTLIEKGPQDNPHVVVTDFDFGGYVVESKNSTWTEVTIALFPKSNKGGLPGNPAATGKEIKAVLSSHSIRDEAALRQFVRRDRIDAVCSDSPGMSGGTIRKHLIESNPGSQLNAAWILSDLSDPPTAETVRNIFAGAYVCFGVAIALSIIVFRLK